MRQAHFHRSRWTFSIDGLNADLLFNLLVASDGYGTKFVNKVDPEKGPAEPAVLQKRVPPEDPAQIVCGKVVDSHGEAVPDALVEQQGAIFSDGGQTYGDPGWIDLIAVLAHTKPLTAAIVKVSPRGMAEKLATVPSGTASKTITVTEGATIRGRLMQDGKPVPHAEVGLTSHSRNMNDFLPEVRIGTDEEGRFELTNVTAGRIWQDGIARAARLSLGRYFVRHQRRRPGSECRRHSRQNPASRFTARSRSATESRSRRICT